MLHISGSVRIGNQILSSWGVFSKLTRVPADWTTLFGKEVSGVGVKVLVFFYLFFTYQKNYYRFWKTAGMRVNCQPHVATLFISNYTC